VYNLIWLHISAERVMLCFSVFPFFFFCGWKIEF
jgi:hypothetical protein